MKDKAMIKKWKPVSIQVLGMMLLLLFVKQVAKYDFLDFEYFVWAALSGVALSVTYYGLRKEYEHHVKQKNKTDGKTD